MTDKISEIETQTQGTSKGLNPSILKGYFLFGFAGMLMAIVLAFILPVKYEAVAVVKLREVYVNSQWQPLETQAEVENWMLIPTVYNVEVIKACDVMSAKHPAESMTELVKIKLPKNIKDIIELHIRRNTPELAERCTQAVFNVIKQQQEVLAIQLVELMKNDLVDAQNRLATRQAKYVEASKSSAQAILYLAMRDDIVLSEQIQNLKTSINRTVNNSTKLQGAVWSSSKGLTPNIILFVINGFLGGLALCYFYTMIRNFRLARPIKWS